MFNNISWSSYVFAIGFVVIIYYAFVLVLFYRNDLQSQLQKIIGRFNQASGSGTLSLERNDFSNSKVFSDEEDQNNTIQEILVNIATSIKKGAYKNFAREEILLSLKLQLQILSEPKENNLKEKINSFIIAEFKNHCSIHLSEDEIGALWI